MDLPAIPESVSIFLDATEISKVNRVIDNFFASTKEYIESLDAFKPHEFLVISGELDRQGRKYPSGRLTYLSYDDRYVVAGVLETRTTFNNLRYTFFRDLSCLTQLT